MLHLHIWPHFFGPSCWDELTDLLFEVFLLLSWNLWYLPCAWFLHNKPHSCDVLVEFWLFSDDTGCCVLECENMSLKSIYHNFSREYNYLVTHLWQVSSLWSAADSTHDNNDLQSSEVEWLLSKILKFLNIIRVDMYKQLSSITHNSFCVLQSHFHKKDVSPSHSLVVRSILSLMTCETLWKLNTEVRHTWEM